MSVKISPFILYKSAIKVNTGNFAAECKGRTIQPILPICRQRSAVINGLTSGKVLRLVQQTDWPDMTGIGVDKRLIGMDCQCVAFRSDFRCDVAGLAHTREVCEICKFYYCSVVPCIALCQTGRYILKKKASGSDSYQIPNKRGKRRHSVCISN